MFTIRPGRERGTTQLPWLDSRHSFSFGDYRDPDHMGFGPLRVINDDRIAGGGGFGAHGHRDMEIITYVTSGALQHQDNLGNKAVIRPGEIQKMTAGTGIVHAEHNASERHPVDLLQIWIVPDRAGHAPGYEQIDLPVADEERPFQRIAAGDAGPGEVAIHQDVALWRGLLGAGASEPLPMPPGGRGWLQVVHGDLRLGGDTALQRGDGVAIHAYEGELVSCAQPAEVLLFVIGPES